VTPQLRQEGSNLLDGLTGAMVLDIAFARDRYGIVAPFFGAKAGDPVERFAAEANKVPVFEILPG
jgi:hypothetical protein